MAIEKALLRAAQEIAARFDYQATRLNREYLELKQKAADKKAERDTARRTFQRLPDYQFKIGIDYQCPACWIERRERSPLSSVGQDGDDDLLRCRTCHSDFLIKWSGA